MPGIGKAKATVIVEAVRKHRAERQVLLELFSYDIGAGLARRIVKRYGVNAAAVVRSNPYQLAEDVSGIGFTTADSIARKQGIAADAEIRLRAGAIYALARATEQGDTCAPTATLVRDAADVLQVAPERAERGVTLAIDSRAIVRDADPANPRHEALFLPEMLGYERYVAARVGDLARAPALPFATRDRDNMTSALAALEREHNTELTATQRKAVLASLTQRLHVITGGPGTGKTTIVRMMTGLLESDRTVRLAAPTGRAAKRLSESTGKPAQTIHRLLEFNPQTGEFMRNEAQPLKADLLVIDEASMIDLPLMAALLKAVAPETSVTFVGDADQLPSVGPGRVFADFVASGVIDVTRLDRIFRQGAVSRIIDNAHRINHGKMPEAPPHNDSEPSDFYLIRQSDPDRAFDTVLELVTSRIPARFGLDPMRDIQVLTPMQKGTLGVQSLNEALQARLNPRGADIKRGGITLREGDRVIQRDNDYDRNVFNGDVGRVVAVDRDKGTARIRYPERDIDYAPSDLDSLALAYALTIHKSQGSEYPAVVVPLQNQHFPMLRRNLLYTAVTRARSLLVLVASPRALELALRETGNDRHSYLVSRLVNEAASKKGFSS